MLCHSSSAFSMAHLWAASSCNLASEHFAKVVKRVFWQRSTSLTALRLKIVESIFSRILQPSLSCSRCRKIYMFNQSLPTQQLVLIFHRSFKEEVLAEIKHSTKSAWCHNEDDLSLSAKRVWPFSIFVPRWTASQGYDDLAFLPKFTLQSAHTKGSSQLSTTNVPLNYREMVQSFCPFYLCWWSSENGQLRWSSESCVTDFNEHSKYGITANWSPNIIVSWLNWQVSLKMKSGLRIVPLPRCCFIALTVLNIKKMVVTENWSCIALVEVTGHCKWKVGSKSILCTYQHAATALSCSSRPTEPLLTFWQSLITTGPPTL